MTTAYTTGQITLTNGSAVVTGVGTAWLLALIAGGMIAPEAAGNMLPIESVDSDTQITAATKWIGASGTYDYALIRDTAYLQQLSVNSNTLARLIAELNAGTLFKYDAAGDLTGRASYDERPKGFSYLVFIGVEAPQLYVKASGASGDWDGPFAYGTGPQGPVGDTGFVNWRGAYAGATAYAKNDGVHDQGCAWVALQATTGHAPPVLPTLSNAYWSLIAMKGADGLGTGDVVGPAGAVADRIAVYNGATGKAVKDGGKSIADIDASIAGKVSKTARRKGILVNGNAMFSQQYQSAKVTAAGLYPADNWFHTHTAAANGAGAQQVSHDTIFGSKQGVNFTCEISKGALAAGDYWQAIVCAEGYDACDLKWGTASAIPAVLRFYHYNGKATPVTYSVSIQSTDGTYVFVKNFTTAANTGMVHVIPVSAPGGGTWDKASGKGLDVRFCMAVGSTYTAPGEGWQAGTSLLGTASTTNGLATVATATNNCVISDVDIYPDPDNTGLAPLWEAPEPDNLLRRCKRLWQFYTIRNNGWGTYAGFLQQIVRMRVSPSFTYQDLGGTSSRFTIANVHGYTVTGGGIGGSIDSISVDCILSATVSNTWWATTVIANARFF